MSKFVEAIKNIGSVMSHQCLHKSEAALNKLIVQKGYGILSQLNNSNFLNWGLWDKKIYQEYTELNFNFAKISETQDIYSPLLLYFLIRPLIKMQCFNKRLLEIGCGNGLGLRASSELLKTDYSLGIDLTKELIVNGYNNFYAEEKINYIQSDAERLPVDNESFDIITNLESSHVYPDVELFFAEVERVLAPNGYFCYADVEVPNKFQSQCLERFIKQNKQLKIIQKINITRLIQASIHERILSNDEHFYNIATILFGEQNNNLKDEIRYLAYAAGLTFMPRWKALFKTNKLRYTVTGSNRKYFWYKKYYFYYLIQKIK